MLHHVSLACGRMQTYSGQLYPPQLTLVLQSTTTPHLLESSGTEPYYTMSVLHVGECRHTEVRYTLTPLLIDPSTTVPYYTMSVSHVEECRHTQARCTPPQLTLVIQSPTTPCLFDMLQNADIPRSDVHPLLIEPSATEPYYTMSV